jgi:Endonuclease NucS
MVRLIGAPKLIPAPFEDEVHDMGDFIMAHPEVLGEDVKVISRELGHGSDVRRLDLLVYDAESNQPGLVELKKDFADEKVLLQTLRYADWLRSNLDTIRYQISRQGWDIDPDEIEDNLKIYIVAPRISRVVAELAQYIQGMEFEFVQIQRFKNADDGQFISVISPLEVPNRTTARARSRLEHDRNSYAGRGIPEDRLDLLDTAVEELEKLCEEESWGLSPRRLKNAVKFQTGGGRNVFAIEIRRRNDHRMRFTLGKVFDPTSCQLTETVKSGLKQRPGTRFWGVPLQTAPIPDYRPLLAAAYSFVTATG